MANNERVVNGVKTRVLHNKDYVEVAERVRIVHELKKEFEIVESAPFQIGDRFIWRVVTKVDGKQYIGNAEVKMNAPKNTPDGTNPFECAETSAIGRALAFAGLGTVESISSYDEIARSQPFVAVVEDSQTKRVVEAKSARTALPSPQAVESKGGEPSVSQVRARIAKVNPTKDGKSVSFEEFYQLVVKKPFASDDAVSPEECTLLNRRLDIIEQSRAKNKAS